MTARATIEESIEYGPIWRTADSELADQFEDFLTEKCFVMLKTKFDENEVSLFFGQAGSVDKVRELYERFLAQRSGN